MAQLYPRALGKVKVILQPMVIRRDPQTPTVKEEIRSYSSQYSARLSTQPNDLIVNLTELQKQAIAKTPDK
jgi:hypothetical protein